MAACSKRICALVCDVRSCCSDFRFLSDQYVAPSFPFHCFTLEVAASCKLYTVLSKHPPKSSCQPVPYRNDIAIVFALLITRDLHISVLCEHRILLPWLHSLCACLQLI